MFLPFGVIFKVSIVSLIFPYSFCVSKCTKHSLDTQHEYGKIEDAMDILKITPEGKNMDTWEQYYM
jgi:hypothetical protein